MDMALRTLSRNLTLAFMLIAPLGLLAQNAKDSKGEKHGPWKETFENTTVVKYEGTFEHGVRKGKFKFYYPTGNLMALYNFSQNGTVARATMYHEDGSTVKGLGKYISQERDSVWNFYNTEGILVSREEYKMGKYHGQVISYMATTKQEEGTHILYLFNYQNGNLHGDFERYYATGQLQEQGKYQDAQRVGTFTSYHKNGKVSKKEVYKHGVKHGVWLYYDENGELLKRRVFWLNKELKGEAAEAKIEAIKSGRESW